MRFFNITIKVKNAKQIKDFKREDAASLSCELFEEDPTCFVYVRRVQKNIVDAIACIDSTSDEKKFAKKFAEKLFADIVAIKIVEGKMKQFMDDIDVAMAYEYLKDGSAPIDRLGLEFYYEIRNDVFDERIVSERKTKASVYDDVKKYFLAEEYKREIDRIFGRKALKKPIGNPAHYLMVSNDANVRMVCSRDLVFSLFQKGRINSRKYTLIGFENRYVSEWHIEQLYKVNAGGVIVLRVDEGSIAENEKRLCRWTWSGIADIIKRYASSVVTIISMNSATMKTRKRIVDSLNGIALVEFSDQEYKGESAVECICEIAKQDGTDMPESEIEKIRKSDRSYSKTTLQRIYSDWRNEYSATVQFPEYAAYYNGKSDTPEDVCEKSAYQKLSEMIGLKNVKKIVDGAINYFKLQNEYKQRNIEFVRPAMHMVFTGNPGTAKTTVARLLAQILRDNKVLSRGELVEVGRADLVGEYVGQTAPQVKEVFRRAKGSVLFIDEAYSLLDDKKGLYGDEAINTIVQEMENARDDVIVIFAGYKNEMDEFVERNPGLSSRIAFHIDFDDYSESELLDITKLLARDRDIILDPSCDQKLLDIYKKARQNPSFGNGRYARNVLEKAKLNQASRIAKQDIEYLSNEQLKTIVAADIGVDDQRQKQTISRLGFY
ncbi:MAG: AAA family ATPase [Clostridia bacterium]|nr:AAA family ATPase [Clostridia bacterium]